MTMTLTFQNYYTFSKVGLLQCVAVSTYYIVYLYACVLLILYTCILYTLDAVRCRVLQCVAVCCSVLQCVAVCCSKYLLRCISVCVCTSYTVYLYIVDSRCSVLQCVAVCCSVLQCVAVCCSVCNSESECVSVYYRLSMQCVKMTVLLTK